MYGDFAVNKYLHTFAYGWIFINMQWSISVIALHCANLRQLDWCDKIVMNAMFNLLAPDLFFKF